MVVGSITCDAIVEGVASTIDHARTSQGEIFNVSAQSVSSTGLDRIDFSGSGGGFVDNIPCSIDNIGIVTRTTCHGI
ncbi:hypothetical protein C7B62_16900 [Pleurocapsa sp. CCALA 161]|nr:hypothetical protein C7B62_16900 [Pleurocapsa sp. CCALA 161]